MSGPEPTLGVAGYGVRFRLRGVPPAMVESVEDEFPLLFEGSTWPSGPVDPGGSGPDIVEVPGGSDRDAIAALVLRALLDRIDRFLVLHAAALTKGERTVLLAAPSYSGKTTLSLGLAQRGWKLLSDDLAPLELATGLVHPFVKALGVREGAADALAQRSFLDESSWELALRRPDLVLLFDGSGGPPALGAPYRMTVEFDGGGAALRRAVAATRGVTTLRVAQGLIVLAVDPRVVDAAALEETKTIPLP